MGLKTELREYFDEIKYDYDKEEIENVLEILEEQEEELDNISEVSVKLLTRLIDDDKLHERVSSKCENNNYDIDPFA